MAGPSGMACRRQSGARCWGGCPPCVSTTCKDRSRCLTQRGCESAPLSVLAQFYGCCLYDFLALSQKVWEMSFRICFSFQIEGGNSFHNVAEAAFTLTLIRSLVAGGVAGSAIGVITLYRAQVCKVCVASLTLLGIK